MSTIDREALTMEAWDRADDARRRALAADVAARVAGTVVELEVDAQGDQRHTMAAIDVRGAHMLLIPGGTVTLGWDPTRPHGLSAAQLDALAGGDGTPLDQMLAYYCAPTRTVTLAPFLLEVAPRAIADWVDDLGDDPLVDIAARVAADGFRLPTDDEWEHAARGGTTTLFRWGDLWPDGVPRPRATHFTGHHVPSPFGIHLLDDPYQVEVVDQPLGFRGGDGGAAVCGDRPPPEPWVTFASAFRWPEELWEDCLLESLESGWVRRALSLP